MKKIFTPIILILAATQCMASGSDSISAADTSRTMTLRDCMEYAIEYSTKNEIQKLDNADARMRDATRYSRHSPRPFRQEHTPTVISDVPWTLRQTPIPIPHRSITVTH